MSDHVPVALRILVERRAHFRCEYCLLHVEDAVLPHEPDHIIATKHRGDTTAENIAYACFQCNRRKGSDLASIDPETGQVTRLFHPRIDAWHDHFVLVAGCLINPLTAIGRATEMLLRLNDSERVERRALLHSVGRYPR